MILRSPSLLIFAISSFSCIWMIVFATASSSSASSEETGSFQLKANSNTRIAWLIDSDSLPWRGSYSFLSSPSDVGSVPFSVPLLSVIDTHSQLLLAECRATLEPTSNWRHFQWILDSSALQCNVSGQEYVVSPFVGQSKIREFNARIASSASTLCLKELKIDSEPENQECPPKFSSASGFSYTPNLDCFCSLSSAEQQTVFNDASSPNSNMQESSIVRRESEGAPPSVVSNPPVAFPMFRPVALSSASQIAASPTEAPTDDDDHFEFVPLPSTVKARAPAEFKEIRVGENNHQFLTVFATKKPPITTTIKDMGAVNDPCIKFECKNNGSCDVGSNFMPFCMCQNGFSGKNCEVRMCDTITCHAGLETCQIRNGRATCECIGEDCVKNKQPQNSTVPSAISQELVCAKDCENGGKCVKSAGQDKNVCKCAEGFLGANCNIRDLCATKSTCAAFGPEAKCLIDAQSLSSKVSNVLINSPYLCMCYNDNSEWVDCSELPQFELPITGSADTITATTIAPTVLTVASNKQNLSSDKSDELPSPVPSISWGPPTPPPLIAATSEDKSNESEKHESTKPQFPLHMHIPFPESSTSKESESGLSSTSKESSAATEGNKPAAGPVHIPPFPMTNISNSFLKHLNSLTTESTELNTKNLTGANEAIPNDRQVSSPTFLTPPPSFISSSNKQASNTSSVKTLENDFSTSVSDVHTPVFASTTLKPTHPAVSVPGGDGDDDEQDGDNGFERVTQIADSAASSFTPNPPVLLPHYNTTTTDLSDLISTNNHSEIHETDHFGVRPLLGGFSPHEEHGGAFVSPSSEHNHVEMKVDGLQHPFNQQHNHTYLPMPVDTGHHLPENNSIVNVVNPNKPKTSKELEFGQKGSDSEDSQENKSNSKYSNKKNSNEISESKAIDHNSVANAELGNRSLPSGSNGNLISWIIAIGVVSFFLLSIATGTICVGRYVRRSRRLHGKYNPAREENAVACTYSMPMTTVSKEERLI